ncbi:MAG: histidine kinase dimerization/phospho-acceptor domain-containing protein, partial [Acidimicrobiia bacterium]
MGRWLRQLDSVRLRATLAAFLVMGLGLAAGVAAVLGLLQRSLLSHVDIAAAVRAEDVATLARSATLPIPLAVADYDDADDALVQVVDGRGQVVASSFNLRGQGPISRLVAPSEGLLVRTVHGLAIDEPDEFRLTVRRADTPSGPVTIYVASNLDLMGQSVEAMEGILAWTAPVLLVLVVGTTWLLVGRALRPVEAMRAKVAAISARALDQRVPEPLVQDEIGRLAKTMNAMLARLEDSNQRQRRFVADASHELKSPLTAARAQLEVALARPQVADWVATASTLLEENQRMERLVHDLLYLARVDEGGMSQRIRQVDLDDLVVEESAPLRARGRVRLDISRVTPTRMAGDADRLRRVLRNLLENAERHAHSTVSLEVGSSGVGSSGPEVWAVVADDGPGI